MLEMLWYILKVLVVSGLILIVVSIIINVIKASLEEKRIKRDVHELITELNKAVDKELQKIAKDDKIKKETKKTTKKKDN